MQRHKFHSYSTHFVQQLHGDDTDRRIQFCEWFLSQRIRADDITFSDEACFHLNRYVSWHNTVYWVQDNPHVQVMLITKQT
jgi:hypothetical protein